MKYLKLLFVATLFAALASCSDKSDNLQRLIPSDVPGVICINVPNVLEKSKIKKGDKLVLPDGLKAIISHNDESAIGQVIRNIPNIGLDIKDKAFVFFPQSEFDCVALIALSNDNDAKDAVTRHTGARFKDGDDMESVNADNAIWAIKDHVLMYGHLRKQINEKTAIKAALSVLDYDGKSVEDNQQMKKLLDSEQDLSAFFNMQKMNNIVKETLIVGALYKQYPAMQLLLDSDIKSISLFLSFNKDKGDLVVDIEADENGAFASLLKAVAARPATDFLKAIPNSMETIMAISVNGEHLSSIPQVAQMLRMVNEMPFLQRLQINEILKSIDGPLAIAMAKDPNFDDETNYVIAAHANNPRQITRLIATYASSLGQEPEIYNGEYIYSYFNKQVKVGIKQDVVYVTLLNYEIAENYVYDDENVRDFFDDKVFGVYSAIVTNGKKSTFCIGMEDYDKLKGEFVCEATNGNCIQQFIEWLCSFRPASDYDYDTSTQMYDESMVGEFHEL